MSNLPRRSLPTAELEIDGAKVTVRSLSRSEALTFTTGFTEGPMEERVAKAEVFLLIHGAGVDEAEAKAWRDEVDVETAGLLIDKIIELSGLTKPAKQGEEPADPKPDGNESS